MNHDTQTAPKLQFYFGLRSPYAWLAQRLIAEHVPAELQAQISYHPYWDPDTETLEALHLAGGRFLYRPMTQERHLYILGDLKRITRRLGYALKWPIDPLQVRWELPHLACLIAARHGVGDAVRQRLFAARWEQGLNICDPTVLGELLAEFELALSELLAGQTDPALRAEAVAALKQAHSKGVFGLPYFVVGRERFWGVDRLSFALAEAGLPWQSLANAWQGEPALQGMPA